MLRHRRPLFYCSCFCCFLSQHHICTLMLFYFMLLGVLCLCFGFVCFVCACRSRWSPCMSHEALPGHTCNLPSFLYGLRGLLRALSLGFFPRVLWHMHSLGVLLCMSLLFLEQHHICTFMLSYIMLLGVLCLCFGFDFFFDVAPAGAPAWAIFLFFCLFVCYRGRPDQGSVRKQSPAAQCGISRVNVRAAR